MAAKKIVTVTVKRSSHPDYELFASTKISGGQLAKRGSQAEIDAWYDKVAYAVKFNGGEVVLVNEQ
jgi:hypothetical protein